METLTSQLQITATKLMLNYDILIKNIDDIQKTLNSQYPYGWSQNQVNIVAFHNYSKYI